MTSPTVKNKTTDSKIVVLGKAAVGKSECTYKHNAVVDEEAVTMEILDTAGQGDVLHKDGHIRWGDGFTLLYAINDRRSFEDIPIIKQYLDDVKRSNVNCVLVGNKTDLLHERKVSTAEGRKLAEDMSCAFFELSARDGGEDINEVFFELHRDIKRRKLMETKGRRRSSAKQVRHVFNKVFKLQTPHTST